jgi:general secretion pathway protein A
MYTSFFGLTEKPFAITPDPRYLFLSERHAEALAYLLYGIDDAGGFVQLTGEVGTGKTTMVRSFLAQLPEHADVALILNPRVTPEEFLAAICDELRVAVPATARGSVKAIVDGLNEFLLAAHARGRRVVVLVDEAQQLSADVLEQVRLLTNLETTTRKLLQIILVGQPELRDVLARNDLRQLAQRVTGRYHLEPLRKHESATYIRHRLKVAGATVDVFTDGALAELHRLGRGIPRVMNVIADRALLGAYTREQHRVTPQLVRNAASEVSGRRVAPHWLPWVYGGAAAVGAILIGIGLTAMFTKTASPPRSTATTASNTAPTVAAPAAAPVATTASETAAAAAPTPPALPALPATMHPAAATVLAFLAAHAPDSDTDHAFAQLFTLWNAHFDAQGERACEQATAQALDCMAEKGTFAQLRLLNRPAILSLVTSDGVEHQVVVAALDDAHAQIIVGKARFTADLMDLQRYWYGEFLVLWRPPVPTGGLLKPGMRGPAIRWLRQALAASEGRKLKGGSDFYDKELQQLVEDFQRGHRLTVDGIAGKQTQVILDSVAGSPNSPTLTGAGA